MIDLLTPWLIPHYQSLLSSPHQFHPHTFICMDLSFSKEKNIAKKFKTSTARTFMHGPFFKGKKTLLIRGKFIWCSWIEVLNRLCRQTSKLAEFYIGALESWGTTWCLKCVVDKSVATLRIKPVSIYWLLIYLATSDKKIFYLTLALPHLQILFS